MSDAAQTTMVMVGVILASMGVAINLALWCISTDIKRFVDACDENERKARGE